MSLDHAFFYKSVNGDRVYDDTSFEHWLKKFFTSGVFLNDLQVTANNDMTVTVGAGYTNIDGKVKIFESASSLIIETAGASYPRIDSIVLERNDSERDILLKVVKGGYSSEPVAHTPIRQDGVYQLVIAQILVNAGAVKVTQADITDTRSNAELCGIVAGAVDQIDFSQVQTQFDAYFAQYKKQIATDYTQYNADMEAYLDQMAVDFAAWFEGIRNQLDEDAAGHLQNQIDEINERLEYAGGSIVEITVGDNEGEYNVLGLKVNLEIDGKTYTETIPSEKVVKFTGVLEVGKAVITCVDAVQEFNAETNIDIPYYGAYECLIGSNGGSGSYEEWLEAGGLNPSSYESLETLLEDEKAIRTLMTKKDAVDVLARFRGEDLATIINHRYVAKWVNYREYAYSTLSAVSEIKNLMNESGMYGMYVTAKSKNEPLVPVLTSDTGSDGGKVIYSSVVSSLTAYKAFSRTNTNGSDAWFAAKNCSYPQYLGYAFTEPMCVNSVLIANRNDTSNINAIKTFKIQGSNVSDFSIIEFETDTMSHDSYVASYEKTYEIGNDTNIACLYWRIYITEYHATDMSNEKNVCIAKLQFYGYQEGETLWQPKGLVPVMTSNTAPYGEATTSSNASSTYSAYFPFRGSAYTNGAWTCSSSDTKPFIQYKFVNPTTIKKAYMNVLNANNPTSVNYKVQASNDGTSFKDLTEDKPLSVGDIYIDINNNEPYLYYRIQLSGNINPTNNSVWRIDILQFYGRQLEALIPPMTSNTTPIGECIGSSQASSTRAWWKGLGGTVIKDDSNPASTQDEVGGWIGYKFASPVNIHGILHNFHNSNASITLGYSDDGVTWTDTDTIITDSVIKVIKTTNVNSDYGYHTHWRVKDTTGKKQTLLVYLLNFYGTPDYESRTYIYDNGVEVMEVSASDYSYTSYTVEEATKTTDSVIVKPSASSSVLSLIGIDAPIDLSNYSCVVVKAIDFLLNNGYAGYIQVGESKNAKESTASANITNTCNYLDINNINGTFYICLSNAANRMVEMSELWLE